MDLVLDSAISESAAAVSKLRVSRIEMDFESSVTSIEYLELDADGNQVGVKSLVFAQEAFDACMSEEVDSEKNIGDNIVAVAYECIKMKLGVTGSIN